MTKLGYQEQKLNCGELKLLSNAFPLITNSLFLATLPGLLFLRLKVLTDFVVGRHHHQPLDEATNLSSLTFTIRQPIIVNLFKSGTGTNFA